MNDKNFRHCRQGNRHFAAKASFDDAGVAKIAGQIAPVGATNDTDDKLAVSF